MSELRVDAIPACQRCSHFGEDLRALGYCIKCGVGWPNPEEGKPPVLRDIFDVLELVIAAQTGSEVWVAKKRAMLVSRRLRYSDSFMHGVGP